MTSRNELCPCGSGKKFKKCCINRAEGTPSSRRDATREADNQPIDFTESLSSISRALIGKGAPASPYAVAWMIDPPEYPEAAAFGRVPELYHRPGWTIGRIASMSTDDIVRQLIQRGVQYSEAAFLAEVIDTESAFSIGEEWYPQLREKGAENQNFLGLGACELWKRIVPEKPSLEMIDDWIQEGYVFLKNDDNVAACEPWWKAWQQLRARFAPEDTTMHDANWVLCGYQSIYNWCQRFDMTLWNASLNRLAYAVTGVEYCAEWLEQFTDEEARSKIDVQRSLANHHAHIGQHEIAENILRRVIEQWPTEAAPYINLADYYAWPMKKSSRTADVSRALEVIDEGLRQVPRTQDTYEMLSNRRDAYKRPR